VEVVNQAAGQEVQVGEIARLPQGRLRVVAG
jgi:hypothetical protein